MAAGFGCKLFSSTGCVVAKGGPVMASVLKNVGTTVESWIVGPY